MAKKTKPTPAEPTVESILEECIDQVRKGLGKKRVSKGAREYWISNARVSIATALENGANWNKDRKNVLPTARKMGKVAAVLANGGIILKWAAEASAGAVQKDPRCPGVGSGGYCDF